MEEKPTVVVCPKCQYGFQPESSEEFRCRNPDCGHVWSDLSSTLAYAFTSEGRKSCPELFFVSGEFVGQSIPLGHGTTRIGRDPACQIQLTNLAVSRDHAQFLRVGIDCAIQDRGSRMGVLVNGRKVDSAELEVGDRIIISGVEIEFRIRYEADHEPSDVIPAVEESGAVTVSQFGRSVKRIDLPGSRVTVGRGEDRDVIIDQPLVSRRQAILMEEGGSWFVVDTKSSLGTFVNGRSVIRQKLHKGDRVQFGPLAFLFDGSGLQFQKSFESLTIRSVALSSRAGNDVQVLDKVSMTVEPGELVGILGPSGSGKTTLLDALSGCRPATSGKVSFNGIELYGNYGTLKSKIGYVPQDDIIHRELTPKQALTYAARLRLPRDTSPSERDVLVNETLTTLGLEERADVPVSSLSGGQRKRVSLGVELLTRCNVLFLDEPTSGLDPATEARMMRLFRRLADQGKSVILTTHVMENIHLLDKVVLLYDGKLVYFGPPADALKYFGVEMATSLYDRLEGADAAELQKRFSESEDHGRWFGQEATSVSVDAVTTCGRGRVRPEIGKQLVVLTARYFRISIQDARNLALQMAQPLIIFFLICLTFSKAWQVLFLSAVAIFWVGCSNAAREIVKERSVYLRERMVGLAIGPYVLSKVGVIALVCLAQTSIAVFFVKVFGGLDGSTWLYFLAFLFADLSGMALGLFISAVVSKPEHAQAVVPIVLIPQIIFAGMIEPVTGLNPVARSISYGVSTRWTYESLKNIFWERSYDVVMTDTFIVYGFTLLLVASTIVALRVKR